MTVSSQAYCVASNQIYAIGYATAKEESTDVVANTSNVSWSAWVEQKGVDFTGATRSKAGKIRVYVNGKIVADKYFPLNKNGADTTVISLSGTLLNVAHNSDGTGSATVGIQLLEGVDDVGNADWRYNSGSYASENVPLSTIPRQTTVSSSVSTIDMGNSLTITGSSNSSSYTHKLYVEWNGMRTAINESLGGTVSQAYTIPTDWATAIPNSTYGTATFILEAYYKGSKVGSSSCDVKVTVPSTYVPSIDSVVVTEANEAVSSKLSGVFVQNMSKLKITTSASGSYGSTVTSIQVMALGKIYTSFESVTDTVLSSNVTSSGAVRIIVIIYDSRGRSKQSEYSIQTYAYTAPTMTGSASRANSSYAVDETDGTYALIGYTYNVASLNNQNSFTLSLDYRVKGTETWTNITKITSPYSQTDGSYKGGNIFGSDKAYEVRLGISDLFTETMVYAIYTVTTTYTLINFGSDGKSIAVGKQSAINGAMEVNMPLYFLYEGYQISLPEAYKMLTELIAWKANVLAGKTKIVVKED